MAELEKVLMVTESQNPKSGPVSLSPLRWMVLLMGSTQASLILLQFFSVGTAWLIWGPVAALIAALLPGLSIVFVFFGALDAGFDPFVWATLGWVVLALVTFLYHRQVMRRPQTN